jgi:hypothetical protein
MRTSIYPPDALQPLIKKATFYVELRFPPVWKSLPSCQEGPEVGGNGSMGRARSEARNHDQLSLYLKIIEKN